MADTEFQATPWAIAARDFWERVFLQTLRVNGRLAMHHQIEDAGITATGSLLQWKARFPQPIADIDKLPPTLTGSTPSATGH